MEASPVSVSEVPGPVFWKPMALRRAAIFTNKGVTFGALDTTDSTISLEAVDPLLTCRIPHKCGSKTL